MVALQNQGLCSVNFLSKAINFYFVRRLVEMGWYIKFISCVMLYKVAKEKANQHLPQC